MAAGQLPRSSIWARSVMDRAKATVGPTAISAAELLRLVLDDDSFATWDSPPEGSPAARENRDYTDALTGARAHGVDEAIITGVVPWSLAGRPVLNVPAGFDAGGLPMGMQLIGRPHANLDVLRPGAVYDKATRWSARMLPTLLGH